MIENPMVENPMVENPMVGNHLIDGNALEKYILDYKNRDVDFKYRGMSLKFALSNELFSSAGIDAGSIFLLKVFSDFLNNNKDHLIDILKNPERPLNLLDSGAGVGVLGITAAKALLELSPGTESFHVHGQDRDELSAIFSTYNARANRIPPALISFSTEPLLCGKNNYDIILTNIPAKAGKPVLEDFVYRSAQMLKNKDGDVLPVGDSMPSRDVLPAGGMVFLVAVNTLADDFRYWIEQYAELLYEESSNEHTVFVYTVSKEPKNRPKNYIKEKPIILDADFPASYPFYFRNKADYEMEKIKYNLETVYGASDFDSPGAEISTAAKLSVKINLRDRLTSIGSRNDDNVILIHDAGQGHFPLWLYKYLCTPSKIQVLLSGRNILSLSGARHNLRNYFNSISILPVMDIYHEREKIKLNFTELTGEKWGNGFNFIAFLPSPHHNENTAWDGINDLAAPGSLILTCLPSSMADRFNKKKKRGFSRIGEIKRAGYRAMAYSKGEI